MLRRRPNESLKRWIDDRRKHAAFYLADDRKTFVLVRATELSIGFSTVRPEVTFGPECEAAFKRWVTREG